MQWRIYYADGSSFEGSDPHDIPAGKRFEVQIVVQPDKDHGRELVHFADFYLWRSDLERWVGVAGDMSAMMAITRHPEEITCVLWGSMMDPYDWADIQARAQHDPGLPEWNRGVRVRDAVKQ